jgi:hypothetical protein
MLDFLLADDVRERQSCVDLVPIFELYVAENREIGKISVGENQVDLIFLQIASAS